MVIGKELPGFITDFFEKIDEGVRAHSPGNGLSKKQKYWGMLQIHPKVVDTFFEYSTAKAHQYISPLSLSQSRLTGS
jgi:hypothetical protein